MPARDGLVCSYKRRKCERMVTLGCKCAKLVATSFSFFDTFTIVTLLFFTYSSNMEEKLDQLLASVEGLKKAQENDKVEMEQRLDQLEQDMVTSQDKSA